MCYVVFSKGMIGRIDVGSVQSFRQFATCQAFQVEYVCFGA